jgi:fumarate hydratase class II
MGEMQVPDDSLYGASTQRAVLNFPVSDKRFPRVFLEALGAVKAAAAAANMKLGKLDPKLGEPVRKAAVSVRDGQSDSHFVVDIYQTGSGTSTNTNANEVIANLANVGLGEPIGKKSPVHPNDHVNMGQSSNDVIPTAIHVSAALDIERRLLPALDALGDSLEQKAESFKGVIKTGRTHLQDATPVTLGQEFSGYAVQIRNCRGRLEKTLENLRELAIGGTAVGTGINTHPDFARLVCEDLNEQFKIPFREAPNHFESLAAKDTCVEVSGAVKVLAVALTKIANDIRWLSSGPRTGIGEIAIPETQPGSSIMPGKVNPVIAESVLQVAAQVMGNDVAVTMGGAAGNFELNVMMPVIAYNLLDSINLLTNACTMFKEKCVDGINANAERCEDTIEQGLSLVTSFAPVIGYDKAAKLSQKAFQENKTIREVAKEEGLFSDEELNRLLDPTTMLHPSE